MLDFKDVHNYAAGKWQQILLSNGVTGDVLDGRHHPCPGCGGKDRMRFDDKDGRGTFFCNGGGTPIAGDGFEALVHFGVVNDRLEALRLVQKQVCPIERTHSFSSSTEQVTTIYDYVDLDGVIQYKVKRTDLANGTKSFSQQTKNGLTPSKDPEFIPLPYRLPEWFERNDLVLIVEGEKCVDRLVNEGFVATTNHGGGGNWNPLLNEWFSGKDVVVIPDNDEVGERHLEKVKSNLQDVAKSIKVCRLPGLPPKGDVADWFDLGNTSSALKALIIEAKDQKPLFGLDAIRAMTVSPKQIESIAQAKPIIDDLIIAGHITIISAPPNAGKTALFMRLAGEMAAKGFEVLYLNADLAMSDAELHHSMAEEGGWRLVIPGATEGTNIEYVIESLKQMADSSQDLSGVVIILDTLKKFGDVTTKYLLKDFFILLRGLTAKGATIVALGHTNKYRDENDDLIFEGVGDVKNDTDELIYLESFRVPDSFKTVLRSYPAKVRAAIEPVCFQIEWDRDRGPQLTRLDELVDVKSLALREREILKEEYVVKYIYDHLRERGVCNATQLIDGVRGRMVEEVGAARDRNVISRLIRLMAVEPFPVLISEKQINGKIYRLPVFGELDD